MKQDLYKQYATIRAKQDVLDSIEKDLKNRILQDMQSKKLVKEKFEFGSFTVASKKNYIFSNKIKKLEENVKLAKEVEITKKIAKIKENPYVTYKARGLDTGEANT